MNRYSIGFREGWEAGYERALRDANTELQAYRLRPSRWGDTLASCEHALVTRLEALAHPEPTNNKSD